MSAFSGLQSAYNYSRVEIFSYTERLVGIASKHGGVVFGGYVRDIIIPFKEIYRSLDDLDFKDLDFWFKNSSNAEAFIASAGLIPLKDESSGRYPIVRGQHMSHYKCKPFVIVDVMVSDFFPVCDFSVNLVSWNGTSLEVHNPYDICVVSAHDSIQKDNKLKCSGATYTINDIRTGLQLLFPEKSRYSSDDIQSYLRHARSDLLSETERAFCEGFIKETKFKPYTLSQITEQIRNNVYDTSKSFIWMAENGHKHRIFELIGMHAANRLLQFKEKRLGGRAPTHGTF
jgi:hypothetical protein